ncbi:putative phospholipid-transporting ATPase IH [Manis javanica]|nr:putative phospholipid-transporting ATPase IH [Manis javanica]
MELTESVGDSVRRRREVRVQDLTNEICLFLVDALANNLEHCLDLYVDQILTFLDLTHQLCLSHQRSLFLSSRFVYPTTFCFLTLDISKAPLMK